jgi:hypothetical protein
LLYEETIFCFIKNWRLIFMKSNSNYVQ